MWRGRPRGMNPAARACGCSAFATGNSLFAIPFIHPGLALAALCAAAIPLLIHLINRRRARRVRWAAMGFLLAANQRSQRRIRLEQWLLLCLRIAILVAFGLAVARPFLPTGTLLGLSDQHWHRVLLVDNSLSASAVCDSTPEPPTADAVPASDNTDSTIAEPDSAIRNAQSRNPAAVDAALELLRAFPRRDAVSVIALAQPAKRVVGEASLDRRPIRDRLESIPATQRSTDLAGGLAATVELLRDSPAAPLNRAVYIISDQATTMWTADEQIASAAAALGEKATLVIVPTTDRWRGNRAVTSLTCSETLPAAGLPMRLSATVANFDDTPARGLVLQVRRDDRIVRRIPVDTLEPGEKREVAFSIVAQSPGVHAIEVRLDAPTRDALPDDDVRRLSLEVIESVPVLLV
ncbi:MAG: BatA domain-containing protein, partial [Planctomycetota bacterium]